MAPVARHVQRTVEEHVEGVFAASVELPGGPVLFALVDEVDGAHARPQHTTANIARGMTPLPTAPDVPAEHRGETRGHLRYEDVSQDGRS